MSEEIPVRVVQAGKKFTIDLEAIPGAGFMWEIIEPPEQIEVVRQAVVSTSKEIGGSSTQRFSLVARQPGNYLLRFGLKRRWEKSPARTAEFSIQAA